MQNIYASHQLYI